MVKDPVCGMDVDPKKVPKSLSERNRPSILDIPRAESLSSAWEQIDEVCSQAHGV